MWGLKADASPNEPPRSPYILLFNELISDPVPGSTWDSEGSCHSGPELPLRATIPETALHRAVQNVTRKKLPRVEDRRLSPYDPNGLFS